MKIAIEELRKKIEATLAQNFTYEDAQKIAAYFIWAEMSGNKTQGIVKMLGTEPIQSIKPKHEMRVEKDTKLSRLINAGAYPAPLAAQIATEVVIAKAKEHGFAIVGVHNTFSSNGAQAYYAEQIGRADLIGIVASSSPAAVAAFGGIDPVFGTNPIGFSFPTNGEPMVFDMATSAMTFYGLVLAKTRGDKIPENMAIDKDGNSTTDPVDAMAGALLPFDRGYKGSGLGMIVEMLAGPLVHAAYSDPSLEGEWGSTFIAIDPELLVDIQQFKAQCSDMLQRILQSRKGVGIEEIRLPGEKSQWLYREAMASGIVDIDDSILENLKYL